LKRWKFAARSKGSAWAFGEKDVVRHNLVQQIIRAYEDMMVLIRSARNTGTAKRELRERIRKRTDKERST